MARLARWEPSHSVSAADDAFVPLIRALIGSDCIGVAFASSLDKQFLRIDLALPAVDQPIGRQIEPRLSPVATVTVVRPVELGKAPVPLKLASMTCTPVALKV